MQNYKKDFPLLLQQPTLAYLDNAATAQRPRCVIEAISDFYAQSNANPLRGLYPLSIHATRVLEQARQSVCTFLDATDCREIIFTRNTTESLNLVAYSYGLSVLKPGDRVVVSVLEHHSNLLPWQMVCQMRGASLSYIPCAPDGSIDLASVRAQIDARTRIVALTHLSNVFGQCYPIRQIADLAHQFGAVLVVDGAQSVAHLPVSVRALDADFFAFSAHKLYGPMGIGVLYGKRALLESMPPFLRGGEMIESVSKKSATFAELPHKFEAGTVDVASAAGLATAISFVRSIGFPEIRRIEDELCAYTLSQMQRIPGVHVLGSANAAAHHGILSFTVKDVHPHDVAEILASRGVAVRAGHHCAQPLHTYLSLPASVRVSFAFYNSFDDADRFLQSLRTVRGYMGYGNE